MTKIAVLDYGIGNVKSICSAISKVGHEVILTKDKRDLNNASGIVIPGVGAFSYGMQKLKEHDLQTVLEEWANADKPILGICLGMQMLFDKSSEFGETQGLGLIPGNVERLSVIGDKSIKLPNVGWNNLAKPNNVTWAETILNSVEEHQDMYFVHSYAAVPSYSEHQLSVSHYRGIEFCSSVRRGNVYGCQFHPEKSANFGLKVMLNFSEICEAQQ